MKQGLTLADLSEQLDFQNENKRDFIVGTENITILLPEDAIDFTIKFKDGENRRKARYHEYIMSTYMLGQVASHTNVPMALIVKMHDGTPKERAEIAKLMTTRLRENPVPRMIRTIVGGPNRNELIARAFLSDRYRVLDNYDLLQAIFPLMQEYKGKIKVESCGLTENRMYLKLSYKLIEGSVGTVGDGIFAVDDIVSGGVTISNSEIGDGPVRVQPYLLRLTCLNGATVTMVQQGQRKIHIGGQRTGVSVSNQQSLSDGLFFLNVQEIVKRVLNDGDFYKKVIAQFRATKNYIIKDIDASVKMLARQFRLSDWERDWINKALFTDVIGDVRRFDLINAITRFARLPGKTLSYTRATELEELGGKLIEMSDADWRIIGSAKSDPEELFKI